MFGQLNAIAREYNFPSTAGLCLYLHINEDGTMMTPRISDDSWQYLFGHLFDRRSSFGGQRLPIGGSIEFDIDLNKARWFDAWASGLLRNPDSAVVTPQPPLKAHWRGESQTINGDEHVAEDHWNVSRSHTVTNSRPQTFRGLPKKLSLVDRLDLHDAYAVPKPQDHPDHSDSPATQGTYASSPILQSAIPKGESDLEHRVNSWMATADLYPVSMTESYQPIPSAGASADTAVMDVYPLERNFLQAVRIDEFLSSVTSAGPRSLTTASPIASFEPSSIQPDNRADEIAPLTPATMTSWGPTDDDWRSDVSSVTRLPSPDVGERMVEDVLAPRPRAVWGNSFGWRSAMTWKQVYPHSSIQTKPIVQAQLQDSDDLLPQYPDLVICKYPLSGRVLSLDIACV